MKKFIGIWFGLFIVSILIGFLFVWPLVWIWNAVIPNVFGWNEITYWQMFGLYVLIQVLFKFNVNIKNNN